MKAGTDRTKRAWLMAKFNVSRYAEAAHFDAEGWHSQLTYRFYGFKRPWPIEENRETLIERILETPLQDGYPVWSDCSVHKQLAVWDIGVWEVFRLAHDIKRTLPRREIVEREPDPDFVDFWPKRTTESLDDFEPDSLRRKANEFLKFSRGEPASVPIGVDLTLTDEQIVSEFKAWLKARRRANASESGWKATSFSEIDFSRWVSGQVLAYFDVTSVAEWLDVRLTKAQIGGLLFPNAGPDFDPEAKVAKSIVPLVKQVFRPETFHALAGQASSRLRKAEAESGRNPD